MTVLYSNHCPLCNQLKRLLDTNKIEYTEENNVSVMLEKKIKRAPMLEVEAMITLEDGSEVLGTKLLEYKDALKWVKEQG